MGHCGEDDTISELSQGELALLISDLDDQLEAPERSARKWGRLTLPAALGVAALLYAELLSRDTPWRDLGQSRDVLWQGTVLE